MRLIDAENLYLFLCGSVSECCLEINNAPTINPEDMRPKGRWVHDINNLYGCSVCLGREAMSHKKLKPFCPNCGAKMEADEL